MHELFGFPGVAEHAESDFQDQLGMPLVEKRQRLFVLALEPIERLFVGYSGILSGSAVLARLSPKRGQEESALRKWSTQAADSNVVDLCARRSPSALVARQTL